MATDLHDNDKATRPAHMTRDWLLAQSLDDLVEIIVEYTLLETPSEPESQPESPTELIYDPPAGSVLDTQQLKRRDVEVDEYQVLPLSQRLPDVVATNDRYWRIILHSHDPSHPPVGLEIRRDSYFGRAGVGSEPDFDLTPYGALEAGVSRQHAILRPRDDQLLVIDLGSTNGTYVNGEQVRPGSSISLKHRDTLTLGSLQFTVMVPGEEL